MITKCIGVFGPTHKRQQWFFGTSRPVGWYGVHWFQNESTVQNSPSLDPYTQ